MKLLKHTFLKNPPHHHIAVALALVYVQLHLRTNTDSIESRYFYARVKKIRFAEAGGRLKASTANRETPNFL